MDFHHRKRYNFCKVIQKIFDVPRQPLSRYVIVYIKKWWMRRINLSAFIFCIKLIRMFNNILFFMFINFPVLLKSLIVPYLLYFISYFFKFIVCAQKFEVSHLPDFPRRVFFNISLSLKTSATSSAYPVMNWPVISECRCIRRD